MCKVDVDFQKYEKQIR